jgi:hypothetical protein
MGRPDLPKYRHHSSGQASVQHRGKRFYLGVWNSPESRKRYAQFVADLELQRATAAEPVFTPANVPRDLLINELIAAYWHTLKLITSKMASRPANSPASNARFDRWWNTTADPGRPDFRRWA